MILVVLYPRGLLQVGVAFELVDGRLDGGGREKVMELGRRKVGNADFADFGGDE